MEGGSRTCRANGLFVFAVRMCTHMHQAAFTSFSLSIDAGANLSAVGQVPPPHLGFSPPPGLAA